MTPASPHLPPAAPHLTQIMLLVAVSLAGAGILLLALYLLHKWMRQTLKPDDLQPGRVRVDDETAFPIAAMQAVIMQLKAAEKATLEKLTRAEQRADQNARQTELIAREIDQAMVIFEGTGFMAHASARVRDLLRHRHVVTPPLYRSVRGLSKTGGNGGRLPVGRRRVPQRHGRIPKPGRYPQRNRCLRSPGSRPGRRDRSRGLLVPRSRKRAVGGRSRQ